MTRAELNQISKINNEIAMWQKELDKIQCKSLVKGQDLTGMPRGGRISDSVSDNAVAAVEIETVIKGLLARIQIERKRLIEYIENINDSTTRQIIFYKCVSNHNWYQVARELGEGYTVDCVKQTYSRFLRKNNIR